MPSGERGPAEPVVAMTSKHKPTTKVVGYLMPPRSRSFSVHPEAQNAWSMLRDYSLWAVNRPWIAGRPLLEVLALHEGIDSDLLVVGGFTDFLRLGQDGMDEVLVIPRPKTPEQIRLDAWSEVLDVVLVPSGDQKYWASLYRRLRHTLTPDVCVHLFRTRLLTREAFAAAVGIHPRTLARALKKHPAHPVGRQTIFQEAFNDIPR